MITPLGINTPPVNHYNEKNIRYSSTSIEGVKRFVEYLHSGSSMNSATKEYSRIYDKPKREIVQKTRDYLPISCVNNVSDTHTHVVNSNYVTNIESTIVKSPPDTFDIPECRPIIFNREGVSSHTKTEVSFANRMCN